MENILYLPFKNNPTLTNDPENMLKKLSAFIANALFSTAPAPRCCRAAAALLTAALLLFRPFTAARVLPVLFWAALVLLALHFVDAANHARGAARRRAVAGVVFLLSAGGVLAFFVRGDRLALWGAGLWAAAAGIAAMRSAFAGESDGIFCRGLSFAEGVMSLAIGSAFLCRLDQNYLDLAPTLALYFFALAMLTALPRKISGGSARRNA